MRADLPQVVRDPGDLRASRRDPAEPRFLLHADDDLAGLDDGGYVRTNPEAKVFVSHSRQLRAHLPDVVASGLLGPCT
jgi:hypothetical protein